MPIECSGERPCGREELVLGIEYLYLRLLKNLDYLCFLFMFSVYFLFFIWDDRFLVVDLLIMVHIYMGFPCSLAGKESACNAGDPSSFPGLGWSPGEGMGYPLPVFMGFPGGSDSKESAWQCRRYGFDTWVGKNPWRRAWQPTLVFLLGKFHGQRSLAGHNLWGCKESDMIERLSTWIGEGHWYT